MNNFCALHQSVMKKTDTIENYMFRIRDAVTLLRDGNAKVNHILVVLCAIRGLDARYTRVKDDLKLNPAKFATMTLESLVTTCNSFVNIGVTIAADTTNPAASGVTTTPDAATTDRNQPPPLPQRPSNAQIKTRLAEANTTCPICLIRHPYPQCRKCLKEGWVVEHDPVKAKAKLEEMGPQHRPPRDRAPRPNLP